MNWKIMKWKMLISIGINEKIYYEKPTMKNDNMKNMKWKII